MTEKDYQRKKNKFLPKIHAWYVFMFVFYFIIFYILFLSFMNHLNLVSLHDYLCNSMKDAKIGCKLQIILYIYVQSIQQVCTLY